MLGKAKKIFRQNQLAIDDPKAKGAVANKFF
jgi:hypothetical protein